MENKLKVVILCVCVCVFQVSRGHPLDSAEDSAAWRFSYTPQTWKPEVCLCVSTVCACLNTLSYLFWTLNNLPRPARSPLTSPQCICLSVHRISCSSFHCPVSGSSYFHYIKQCFAWASCLHLIFHVCGKLLLCLTLQSGGTYCNAVPAIRLVCVLFYLLVGCCLHSEIKY